MIIPTMISLCSYETLTRLSDIEGRVVTPTEHDREKSFDHGN